MDLLVVVLVLGILLSGEGSQRHSRSSVGVLGADHEADLAGGVSRDGAVSVLGNREHLLAGLLEVGDDLEVDPDALSLGGDDTLLGEGLVEQLKVGLLKQGSSRALGVRGVSDDDIKGVLVLSQELEAVANVDLDTGVVEANGHVGEVQLRDTGDSLVNVAEHGLLDTGVLDDLTENTTVTAANDKNLLGVGVGVEGEVGDHLLVSELITLGHLNGAVQNEDIAVVSALKDQDLSIASLAIVLFCLSSEINQLTSWYLDCSTWRIFFTRRAMAWPGHMVSEISLNQPS